MLQTKVSYCTDLDLILMTVWQNFVNFKTFDAFKVVYNSSSMQSRYFLLEKLFHIIFFDTTTE